MEQTTVSDDEIIANARRSDRKRMRAAIWMSLASWPLFAIVIVVFWGDFAPLTNSRGLLGTIVLTALLILPPVAAGAGIHLFLRLRYPVAKEARSENIIRKRIDDYQTQRRWITLLVLLVFLQKTYDMAEHPPSNETFGWLFAGMFVLMTILFSAIACFGRGLIGTASGDAANDELTGSLRASAVRLGYFTIMAALGTTYLATLYRPALATFVLPVVMFAGVAVPVVIFLIMEWRAGHVV